MWLTARVILLLTLISDFAASVKDSKLLLILSNPNFIYTRASVVVVCQFSPRIGFVT